MMRSRAGRVNDVGRVLLSRPVASGGGAMTAIATRAHADKYSGEKAD